MVKKVDNKWLLIGGGVAIFLAYSVVSGGFKRFLDMFNTIKPWPDAITEADIGPAPEGWEGSWPPKMYWA